MKGCDGQILHIFLGNLDARPDPVPGTCAPPSIKQPTKLVPPGPEYYYYLPTDHATERRESDYNPTCWAPEIREVEYKIWEPLGKLVCKGRNPRPPPTHTSGYRGGEGVGIDGN